MEVWVSSVTKGVASFRLKHDSLAQGDMSCTGIPGQAVRELVSYKLDELQRALLRLRSIHNATLAVNRLPSELLVEIFFHVRAAASRYLLWTELTHVCHHWRAVALATPLLWNEIATENSLSFVRACLERSGGTPITLTCRAYVANIKPIMDTILPCCHKIRALKFWALSEEAAETLFTQAGSSMPNLDTLTLHVHSGLRSVEPLHLSIFDGQFAHIQSLSLKGIAIHGNSWMRAELVHLDLSNTLHKSSPPMGDFLDALSECRRLETFKLSTKQHRSVEKAMFDSAPNRRVVLPNLRRMKLETDASIVYALLAHLVVPSCALFEIKCIISSVVFPASIISVLFPQNMAGLANLCDVRSLYLFVSLNIFRVRAFETAELVSIKKLDLEVEYDPPADMSYSLPRALSELAQVFTQSPVVDLQVFGDQSLITVDHWQSTLSCLSQLERLEIGSRGMVGSLFESLGHLSEEQSGSLLCPRMKQLCVSGARLDEEAVGLMAKSIMYRMSQGRPLSTFALTSTSQKECMKAEVAKMMEQTFDSFLYT